MNYVIEAAFGGAIVLAVVAFILAPVGVDELIRRMR